MKNKRNPKKQTTTPEQDAMEYAREMPWLDDSNIAHMEAQALYREMVA